MKPIRIFYEFPLDAALPLFWTGMGEADRRVGTFRLDGKLPGRETRLLWQITLEGAGEIQVGNDAPRVLGPGTCFLARRPSDYAYYPSPTSSHWKFVWMSISGTLLQNLWESFGKYPVRILEIPRTSPEVLALRRLVRTHRNNNLPEAWQNVQDTFKIVLPLLRRVQGSPFSTITAKSESRPLRSSNLLTPVQRSPGISISKVGWADQLGVSRFQLHRAIRKKFGMSPKEVLTQHRLKLACQYLKRKDWPISKVAKRIGMPSANYFAQFFRNRTGLTPTEWRKQFAPKG
jgi:AraC-like DNA-binding protein